MSFARQLLYSIADQLGRNRKQMEQFIQILQKNWYDTKQSMRQLSYKQLQSFNFPAKLIQMIMNRVGSNQNDKFINNNKMEIQNPLSSYLNNLKTKVMKTDFQQIISLLIKIFVNIRDNITEEKYRHLKKTNQKINKLTSLQDVQKVLEYGGFHKTNEGYTMAKINFGHINQCIEEINRFAPKVQFNPYQQQIISLGTSNKNFQGETSAIYTEKLQQLQKQRSAMMSKPIKDRDIKIYQVKQQLLQKMDIQFNQKQQLNQDQRIYMQNVKQILKKSGQDPKFMNRRKKQYYDLLKHPCFTQTTIRVKLPDNWVFECKFAPLQTLQTLVDIFHQNLQAHNIEYYLYMTPPVQILKGMLLRQSFYELGCAPKAVFYFKTEQEVKGRIMKEKKNGGFFSNFFN